MKVKPEQLDEIKSLANSLKPFLEEVTNVIYPYTASEDESNTHWEHLSKKERQTCNALTFLYNTIDNLSKIDTTNSHSIKIFCDKINEVIKDRPIISDKSLLTEILLVQYNKAASSKIYIRDVLKPVYSEKLKEHNFAEVADKAVATRSNEQSKALEVSEKVSSFVLTLKEFQSRLNLIVEKDIEQQKENANSMTLA
jgi:hypothetical protein